MSKIKNYIRIVIPAYKAEKTIIECVNSVCKALFCFENWEIIIVDNGLNPNLQILLDRFPVQIIKETKIPSAAYARNKGAENFSEGILVFIDSDVILEKECLKILTKPLLEKKEIATIGNYSKEVNGLNFAQKYKQLYIHHIYKQHNSLIKNDFWTAISAMDASVFHELNGFNISFKGANGEDQELGIRLSKNNYSVASIPQAKGKHINPYTIKKIVINDFRKGITAFTNSYGNKIPLTDNRHVKGSSMFAVLFASLFSLSLAFMIIKIQIIFVSMLLLFAWYLLRYDLIKTYFKNLGINFTVKAFLLILILDIVRCVSVISGLFQEIFLPQFNFEKPHQKS